MEIGIERINNGFLVKCSYYGDKYRKTLPQAIAEAKRMFEQWGKDAFEE